MIAFITSKSCSVLKGPCSSEFVGGVLDCEIISTNSFSISHGYASCAGVYTRMSTNMSNLLPKMMIQQVINTQQEKIRLSVKVQNASPTRVPY